MTLQECFGKKTYSEIVATVDSVWEPDWAPNEAGFMSQQVALTDASGQHTVTISTKFKDGFLDNTAEGQVHHFKIKCYENSLQGYSLKPKVMGKELQYNKPTQAQQTQYNQAGGTTTKNLHPYNAPREVSIHRQCAMKAAVEMVTVGGVSDNLENDRQDLVDWAEFFVHYYRTGNANQPDASITKKTDVDLSEPQSLEDMGQPNF